MSDWVYLSVGAFMLLWLFFKSVFALITWQLGRWKGVTPGN